MDCLEFRRRIGAEPRSRERGLLAHRDSCAACAAVWERAQHFENELDDALSVPVPEGLVERVLLAQATGQRQRQTHRRRLGFGLAIAASLLIVLAGGGMLWRQLGTPSLPAMAVAHVLSEMPALATTRPVSAQAVAADFAGRGVALRGPVPVDTTFVRQCIVGPYRAVHMVTRRDGEAVAVLYLPHKQIDVARDFRRNGWHGREVPLERGTLVMLTDHANTTPFNAIERGWRIAIDGLDGPRVSQL